MRGSILAVSSLLVAVFGGIGFLGVTADVTDAPRRLDAADLDGDGDVDLFVLADGAGQVASLQVLLNDGGAFTAGWSATQSTGDDDLPFDLDLADTNGDGHLDALYLLPSGAPYQRFNDGDGNFGAADGLPAFAGRAAQGPGDLDGDGDTDLVYYEEDIIGYLGTLQGSDDGEFEFDFSTETWFGLVGQDYARRFELGDVTGDGLQDLAMASTHGVQYFRGKPPAPGSTLPGWVDQQELYTTPCGDIALVDLDGDAGLDLVASVPSLHSVVVLLKQHGGFSSPVLYPAGTTPEAITTADIDLDGKADVIVANRTAAKVSVLPGTGAGGFLAPVGIRVGRQPTDVVAADFDADGDDDLAVACAVSSHVAILFNESL